MQAIAMAMTTVMAMAIAIVMATATCRDCAPDADCAFDVHRVFAAQGKACEDSLPVARVATLAHYRCRSRPRTPHLQRARSQLT